MPYSCLIRFSDINVLAVDKGSLKDILDMKGTVCARVVSCVTRQGWEEAKQTILQGQICLDDVSPRVQLQGRWPLGRGLQCPFFFVSVTYLSDIMPPFGSLDLCEVQHENYNMATQIGGQV